MAQGGSRHDLRELFEATGERAQIYARDTRLPPDAPLVRLERGMADVLRPAARAGHLICPLPGCEDPRYTTRAGSRRDHFAHLNLVNGHAPESWFHYTGKQLVGAWLRERYPEARVVVDHERIASGQQPDVLAVFPDGRRIAFEIQYAALDVDDWAFRHLGYALSGIADIWLFGHGRTYLRRNDADRYAIPPLIAKARESGVPVHWLNPDEGLIASPRRFTDPRWGEAIRLGHDIELRDLDLAFDALADCRLDRLEFLTPIDLAERAAEAAAIEARAQAAERARAAAEAERRAGEDAAQETERRAAAASWGEQQRLQRAFAYEREVRPGVVRDLGPVIELIETELRSDRAIYLHHADWHARFWRLRIEGKVGASFAYGMACGPFMEHGRDKASVYKAVTGYLFFLSRRGIVEFRSSDWYIEGEITVLADATHLPTFEDQTPEDSWSVRLGV